MATHKRPLSLHTVPLSAPLSLVSRYPSPPPPSWRRFYSRQTSHIGETQMARHPPPLLLLLLLLLLSLSPPVHGDGSTAAAVTTNPFSPKAAALRYWAQKIPNNNLAKPEFLVSKLSPLTPQKSASLLTLANQNALSRNLPMFCSWAHLFCFPDLSTSLAKHRGNANFVKYSDQNFTNYGSSVYGGFDSFKNYSDGENLPVNSFVRYGRGSVNHLDKFAHYAPDTNVASGDFSGYGIASNGGATDFNNYDHNINVPNLRFTSYSGDGLDHTQTFTSYSDGANAGDQSFRSYGKAGSELDNKFTSYGKDSNVIGSTFTGYGEHGNWENNTFTSYAFDGNNPQNNFHSYGDDANGEKDTFTSYRDQSNVGDDTFTSYGKNAIAKETFINYGNSSNVGTDTFKLYGKDAALSPGQIGFIGYGINTTFKSYTDKKSMSFAKYTPSTSDTPSGVHLHSGISSNNKWVVEEGKFFRESALKQGHVMKMPDIEDKMPERSFLPRSISKKIPFSSARMAELLRVFNSDENSTFAQMVEKTLGECERAPSRGETKRCVASAEDMIDFAVEVLGKDTTVKTTEGLGGNKGTVEIGQVKGINGGRITKSVSCHQSLFPYLVYFCHSVPKVRVYEADILDTKTKQKINRGVAICHIDTSAWGPGHGAFLALGSGPGKIEVCHWIFQNDMTWVVAD